jgi:hypothetical protein
VGQFPLERFLEPGEDLVGERLWLGFWARIGESLVAVEVALEGKGAELEGGLQGVFHQLLIKLSSSPYEIIWVRKDNKKLRLFCSYFSPFFGPILLFFEYNLSRALAMLFTK